MRKQLHAHRRILSPQVTATATTELVMWIAQQEMVDEFLSKSDSVVAAYVPAGNEPGSIKLLDKLSDLGCRVLLPVVDPGPPSPLRWATYEGPESLRPGRFGLLEPTGEALPTETILTADLVLVPALAVDQRGVRLGRGAGYYDRTIGAVDTNRLVAVVYDHEVLEHIPGDEFDVAVGWSLTPSEGFRRLGTI